MVLKQTGSVQAQKLIVFDYEDHWLRLVLIPEEAAPQFRDDVAPRNGMMPPPPFPR
jgi:hypothetical protein